MKNYMIVENTPGYLPDDENPATFDSYAEALRALVEYNKELSEEVDSEGTKVSEVNPIENGWFNYFTHDVSSNPDDRGRQINMNDLGRVVQIIPVEGE